MKLFGKKEKKQEVLEQTSGEIAGSSSGVAGAQSQTIKKKLKHPRLILLIIFALLVSSSVVAFLLFKPGQKENDLTLANKYVRENNTPKALAHAKKALELEPNNVDAILAVANLTLKDNPEESKQYFARALEIYKEENNPDADGGTAINYWAAAGLADQAGQYDLAKKYYQKVIDTADAKDAYHQDLVRQSKLALERLR